MAETQQQAKDAGAERFLNIEDAAAQLAQSLVDLGEASEQYKTAASRLEEATAVSTDLVSAVHDVGGQARQALEVVASVGGPTILKRIDAVDSSLAKTQANIDTLLKRLRQLLYAAAASIVLLIVILIVALMK